MSIDNSRSNLALGLLRTAYNDYIAARVLLNKNYTLQGVILASTAVEKYLKAAIFIQTGRRLNVHFDKFEILRDAIVDMGYVELIDKIDTRFIQILSKAYRLRYYDNITKPTTISFFKNQFLGELDGAVELFERLFKLKKLESNEPMLSPLKLDYKKKNPDLFENNWVTTGEKDKKKFMETDCIGFAIQIFPDNLFEEIHVESSKMDISYDGTMWLIEVNGTKNI